MIPSMFFTVASVAAMLLFGHMGWGYTGVLKMCASTGFLAMAVAAGAFQYRYGMAILLALLFSWFGDLFLIFDADAIFLMGLVAFLLGHLAFAFAFWVYGLNIRWVGLAAAALLLPVAGVIYWLHPHLEGPMTIAVYLYMLVITLMVCMAFGAVGRGASCFVVVAALMFFVSDIFVARSRFVVTSPWNGLIGLPLYFGAQIVFAYTVHLLHPSRRLRP